MSMFADIWCLTSQKRYAKISIQSRTYVWIVFCAGIYELRSLPVSSFTYCGYERCYEKVVAENYCRFTIGLPFKKGNFCDRHFNRKIRFGVWVLLLYNF